MVRSGVAENVDVRPPAEKTVIPRDSLDLLWCQRSDHSTQSRCKSWAAVNMEVQEVVLLQVDPLLTKPVQIVVTFQTKVYFVGVLSNFKSFTFALLPTEPHNFSVFVKIGPLNWKIFAHRLIFVFWLKFRLTAYYIQIQYLICNRIVSFAVSL